MGTCERILQDHATKQSLVHHTDHAALLERSGKILLATTRYAMAVQAYGNWQTLLNESLVRAATICYMQAHDYPHRKGHAGGRTLPKFLLDAGAGRPAARIRTGTQRIPDLRIFLSTYRGLLRRSSRNTSEPYRSCAATMTPHQGNRRWRRAAIACCLVLSALPEPLARISATLCAFPTRYSHSSASRPGTRLKRCKHAIVADRFFRTLSEAVFQPDWQRPLTPPRPKPHGASLPDRSGGRNRPCSSLSPTDNNHR